MPTIEETILLSLASTSDISPISLRRNATCLNDLLLNGTPAPISFEQLPFAHPLFILYSSGTTGQPKCFVHGQGGVLIQHLKEYRLQCDIGEGDRVFYHTTCGWMMWNWLASGLSGRSKPDALRRQSACGDGNILFDLRSGGTFHACSERPRRLCKGLRI